MIVCMRATMNLPDGLLAEAKRRAASEGRTLTSLVEESLRARLGALGSGDTVPPELPQWHGGRMLVDITDADALWGALEEPA